MNGDVVAQAAEALAAEVPAPRYRAHWTLEACDCEPESWHCDTCDSRRAAIALVERREWLNKGADAILGSSDAVTLHRAECQQCGGRGAILDDCGPNDCLGDCARPCSSCGGSGKTIEATETERATCSHKGAHHHGCPGDGVWRVSQS